MSKAYPVDPSMCAPQPLQANSCNGFVCNYTVEVPCFDDGGSADAGSDGGMPCDAWCKAATPPNVTPQQCQFVMPLDGGTGVVAQCGVCGL
jgi:hypothetical protein